MSQVAVQRPRTGEAAREEAVVHEHAGVEPQREVDEAAEVPVSRHVAAHVPGAVGEAVGESGVRREQEEVGTPGVAGGEHEGARAELDGLVRCVPVDCFGDRDPIRARLRRQTSDEGAGDEVDAPVGEQPVEGEVGRVLRPRGTDGAGVAAPADVAALVGLRVARPRLRPEGDVGLFRPLPHAGEVVGEGQRRHGVGLRARIVGGRPLLARDADALLGLLVVRLEIVEGDGPVRRDPVQRAQAEVLRGEARDRAAPVHRRPADEHGVVHGTGARLGADVIVRPRVLAVGQHPRPSVGSFLERRRPLARFDHGDGGGGPLGEPLGHHGRRDPAADDADVALDDPPRPSAHAAHGPARSGSGSSSAPSMVRHSCFRIARP